MNRDFYRKSFHWGVMGGHLSLSFFIRYITMPYHQVQKVTSQLIAGAGILFFSIFLRVVHHCEGMGKRGRGDGLPYLLTAFRPIAPGVGFLQSVVFVPFRPAIYRSIYTFYSERLCLVAYLPHSIADGWDGRSGS